MQCTESLTPLQCTGDRILPLCPSPGPRRGEPARLLSVTGRRCQASPDVRPGRGPVQYRPATPAPVAVRTATWPPYKGGGSGNAGRTPDVPPDSTTPVGYSRRGRLYPTGRLPARSILFCFECQYQFDYLSSLNLFAYLYICLKQKEIT